MPLRVYLVEDSAIMSRLLHELLALEDAVIIGHSDTATDAIARIEELEPDVVILDIALRDGTGFDVLGKLRRDRSPIRIVLTNYSLEHYRLAAEDLGADYFFDKSNEIPVMMQAVRSIARGKSERANGTG